MIRRSDFQTAAVSIWFRLTALEIIGLVFYEALDLATGRAQGWSYYLTSPEVAFEVIVRLIAAALAGLGAGSVCTALILPFLWHFRSSRMRLTDWAVKAVVVSVLFLDSRFALKVLVMWSHGGAKVQSVLLTAHFITFVAAVCIPRRRSELVMSLGYVLTEKVTRRTVIAASVGTAALAATEFALSETAPQVRRALAQPRPKSNFLLITFDALCAEDMSLYGYRLPTTPNIDAFARKATVFTNYFSASTFTTPSVAAILTGVYPSESHVYHLQGRVRPANVQKSLPHAMRAAGYATGALICNPYAYNLAASLESEYDFLPEPTFPTGGLPYLWDATAPLHQDSGIGSRVQEHFDLESVWEFLGKEPNLSLSRMRPHASFDQARKILTKLPDGFFLWVHVMSPHSPYIPDLSDRGRFLSTDNLRTWEKDDAPPWTSNYQPEQQTEVDKRRLRYDEFIGSTDRAFGTFISDLERSGKLRDTTVIVSADHGESFEGGVYQHGMDFMTRPVIHIPLIVRLPNQQVSSRCAFAADETALAPTILELAGRSRPDCMRGESLVRWLSRDGQGQGEGLAFSQYIEQNSVYAPLKRGTVGVIDGHYQYILDLATHKGTLRPLNEAHIWKLDRSAEDPARAEAMRATIYARFPDLPREST